MLRPLELGCGHRRPQTYHLFLHSHCPTDLRTGPTLYSLLGLHHLPAPLKRTHQLWPKARWPLKWRVTCTWMPTLPRRLRWPLHIKNWNTTSAERDNNNASQITARCKEYNINSKNGDSHNFTNILELHNQPVCLSKSISSYFPTWNPSSHFTQSSHICHFCSFESYSFKCGQKALLGPSALLEVAPGHRRPLVFPLTLNLQKSLKLSSRMKYLKWGGQSHIVKGHLFLLGPSGIQ